MIHVTHRSMFVFADPEIVRHVGKSLSFRGRSREIIYLYEVVFATFGHAIILARVGETADEFETVQVSMLFRPLEILR